jgi:hypothetical protein
LRSLKPSHILLDLPEASDDLFRAGTDSLRALGQFSLDRRS